jgi:hypothetical protein
MIKGRRQGDATALMSWFPFLSVTPWSYLSVIPFARSSGASTRLLVGSFDTTLDLIDLLAPLVIIPRCFSHHHHHRNHHHKLVLFDSLFASTLYFSFVSLSFFSPSLRRRPSKRSSSPNPLTEPHLPASNGHLHLTTSQRSLSLSFTSLPFVLTHNHSSLA